MPCWTLANDGDLALREWRESFREASLARAALAEQELEQAPQLLAQFMEWVQGDGFSLRGKHARVAGQLPRDLHWRWDATRRVAIQSKPPCHGNRWDALLTAVVEHVALSHRDPHPDWADDLRRFLNEPWFDVRDWTSVSSQWLRSPAAFLRHNAFLDPAMRDARGGEREDWDGRSRCSRDKPFPCPDRGLQRLAETLARFGLAAKVLLVGGRVFTFVYRRLGWNDVPCLARFRLADESVLHRLAAGIARERSLPSDWLQSYALREPPRKDSPLSVYCSKPALCVTGCKPSLPLAIGLLARQAGDDSDIRFLMDATGVRSFSQAERCADDIVSRSARNA